MAWLLKFGLDRRFVELTAFMTLGTWICGAVLTFGMLIFGWRIVLLHQAVAFPFSVLGWAMGFRVGQGMGLGSRTTAMVAGWAALLMAEFGLAGAMNLIWTGSGGGLAGAVSFPVLSVLVTIGVLWLYRAETWARFESENKGTAA